MVMERVTMKAMPGSALEVIEPELVPGGLETVLDGALMARELHQRFQSMFQLTYAN